MKKIVIETKVSSLSYLRNLLIDSFGGEINLEYRESANPSRGADPTVLVAVIGMGSAAIAAFISGIFDVCVNSRAQKIILQGKTGRKIEIPADFPIEDIDNLVNIVKELDLDRVTYER